MSIWTERGATTMVGGVERRCQSTGEREQAAQEEERRG